MMHGQRNIKKALIVLYSRYIYTVPVLEKDILLRRIGVMLLMGGGGGERTDLVGENLPPVPHSSPKIPTSATELSFTTQ